MFQKIKGFHDILGVDIVYWQRLEDIIRKTYKMYGYDEVRLPILEKTSVFNRGIGETTDIVEKEMFTFTDRDGESVSLRPEGTASLIRAYIENVLYNPPAVRKFFYMGAMFRRERPQKGRFRQFTQSGIEVLDCASPILDAEVISLLFEVAKAAGVADMVRMQINSIGCPVCRPSYQVKLKEFLHGNIGELCDDCQRRLDKNPLRILDCKNERCSKIVENAPVMLDNLCDDCSTHFEEVKKHLAIFDVAFDINKKMVRGLDYYVKTAYELVTDRLGSASAVGAGGRYDGLVKLMGGKDIAGIGFAIGMDRMVALMKENEQISEEDTDVFVIFFDDDVHNHGFNIVKELRVKGYITEFDYDLKAMKNQMKKADRSKAKIAIILGGDELQKGAATVKSLADGSQNIVELADVVNFVADKIMKDKLAQL